MGDSDVIGTLLLIVIVLIIVFFILYYTCALSKAPVWLVNVFKTISPHWDCDTDNNPGHLVWHDQWHLCGKNPGGKCKANSWPLRANIDAVEQQYCCYTPVSMNVLSCETGDKCAQPNANITKGSKQSPFCCSTDLNNINKDNILWQYPQSCEQMSSHKCISPKWSMDLIVGSIEESYCCEAPHVSPRVVCSAVGGAGSQCPPEQYKLETTNMHMCCKDATTN